MEYEELPVLTPKKPGKWISAPSLSKARGDAEAFLKAANNLKNQFESGKLDPSSVLAHAQKLRVCLDILEEHARNPTKYS